MIIAIIRLTTALLVVSPVDILYALNNNITVHINTKKDKEAKIRNGIFDKIDKGLVNIASFVGNSTKKASITMKKKGVLDNNTVPARSIKRKFLIKINPLIYKTRIRVMTLIPHM